MAKRRMYSQDVTDNGDFLDMPLSAQALYFHLGMKADDDGFVSNARQIARMIGASTDDLKLLLVKNFALSMNESDIIVIKHWRINNYLRNDRYKPSQFDDLKQLLYIKTNNSYTLDSTQGKLWYPFGIPMVSTGKDSIGKYSKDKNSKEVNSSVILPSELDKTEDKNDKTILANGKSSIIAPLLKTESEKINLEFLETRESYQTISVLKYLVLKNFYKLPQDNLELDDAASFISQVIKTYGQDKVYVVIKYMLNFIPEKIFNKTSYLKTVLTNELGKNWDEINNYLEDKPDANF